MLECLLYERFKPALTEQITTLENIFTLKMKTLLIQRRISATNILTTDMDRTQNRLQQENIGLQTQIQHFTRELRSTVAVRISPNIAADTDGAHTTNDSGR